MLIGGGAVMGICYLIFGEIGIGWFAVIFVFGGFVNLVRGIHKSFSN
jgi:hypothetical protein